MITSIYFENPAMKPTEKAHDVFQAGYRTLLESGELEHRARIARQHLQDCNLCARYCHVDRLQTIQGAGREVTAEELAAMMLDLQVQGCHNINFVSPSLWRRRF